MASLNASLTLWNPIVAIIHCTDVMIHCIVALIKCIGGFAECIDGFVECIGGFVGHFDGVSRPSLLVKQTGHSH